jgi:adenosine deaminase
MAEMHAWIDKNTHSLFTDAHGRLLGFEGALVLALKDGVTRVELGEDVWGITLDYGSAADLARAYQDRHRQVAPQIEWIRLLGMFGHCPIESLIRWLTPFLELNLYQSIDLSGDELAQPTENFLPLYRLAKDSGLTLKAHVGEWAARTTSGAQSNCWSSMRRNTALLQPARKASCGSSRITISVSTSAQHRT